MSTSPTPAPKKSTQNIIVIVAAVVGCAVAMVVVQLAFNRGGSSSYDRVLVKVANDLNKNLPMAVDRETRWDSTVAGPGNRLTYLYTLVNVARAEIDADAFNAAMKPKLINSYKTNPDMASFRKKLVELHYHYRDKNGVSIATIVLSPKDF